ncbi:MAG: T9SS type A sorting domain-containing protein [Bacteroidia bacterium]|nr:T9SS type A sorting domain-containing protein [Bacteroidia bacterium]
MRKLLFILYLTSAAISGQPQNIGDYPVYPVPERYRLKGGAGLPYRIDNSQKKFFPAVFDQNNWSCNQASSIGYVFNYEINRLRNLASSGNENLYTPGFVWNFLNSANGGVGVSYFDSWEIVKTAGCPNYVDYPYYWQGYGIWMSGYEKYYRAMQNRISVNYSLPVGTPEGLALLKQYLVDHFENSPDGGVANFQIASDRMDTKYWTDPETSEQWPVIWTFGNNVGHAMTFVGYNDSVRVDLNNDGKFTNDRDINKDGLVDMKDWEIGAFLAVNSWGQGFMKGGKAFVLYSVVAHEGNDGGIWNRSVHVIKAIKNYTPELTMRVVMRHEQRKRFGILAGFSTNANALEPEQTLSFPIFNHQGDNSPLVDPDNPDDSRRFEFGLDITQFINSIEPGVPVKFFLIVEEIDPNNVAAGVVDEFSVIHYLNGADEVISSEKNVAVVNNGTTYVSLTQSLNFNKLKVEEPLITNIITGQPFYAQLSARGGQSPYRWELVKDYKENTSTLPFGDIAGDTLSDFSNKISFRRVNLPFEFSFYGTKYKSLIADIKGALHFDNEYYQYPYAVNKELAFRVRKSIVPFGADIQINVRGDAFIYYPTDSMVAFEWKASVYTGSKVYPLSVIARLYADGRIEFQYGNRSVPVQKDYPWLVGISNGDQNVYKYASVSENQLMFENYAITFSPSDYPANLVLTEDGTLSGLASENDHQWNILVKVSDSYHQVQYASIPISTISRDTAAIVSKIFPNPFNRSTGISFKVTEEMPVILDIYDFSGRKVMEVLNRTLLPGDFTFFWNARDELNRNVKPGTYIYQLRIGNHKETGKMLLIR